MKDFFNYLPTTTYQLDGNIKKVVDITVTAIITEYRINSTVVLWRKEVADGDTPIIISNELYKNPAYYWTIMYLNNIINPYTDWYMTQSQLELYIKQKYGSEYDKLRVIEWYDASNDTYYEMDDVEMKKFLPELEKKQQGLDHIFPHNARAVTNVYWETRKNMTRKFIRVIAPQYVEKFIELFDQTINRYEE